MLKIALITDIHLVSIKSDKLYNIPICDLFATIIDTIKQNELAYDFVVLSGDLADKGCKEAYKLLCHGLSVLTIPCYWIAGNHDNLEVLQEISADWQLLNDKSFTQKGVHFTLLNSVEKDEDGKNKARGKLEKSELTFLDTDLLQYSNLPCVIVLHHPPVFSGTWKDDKMLKNYDEFFDVIDKYPNVQLVLYGHQHQVFQSVRNNVIYYSPPAASFQFDKEVKWAFENSFSGYGIIEIDNSGKISCWDKRVNFLISPIYAK
jgi:Icc protein